mgnify:CR=1 FL=1
MAGRKKNLPLVYSCSGCSSAAQMANHVALRLDREGEAEMSCIAGVGGNVPHLVNIARSGRPILARSSAMRKDSRRSSRPASSGGGVPAPGEKGLRIGSMRCSLYKDLKSYNARIT